MLGRVGQRVAGNILTEGVGEFLEFRAGYTKTQEHAPVVAQIRIQFHLHARAGGLACVLYIATSHRIKQGQLHVLPVHGERRELEVQSPL